MSAIISISEYYIQGILHSRDEVKIWHALFHLSEFKQRKHHHRRNKLKKENSKHQKMREGKGSLASHL